MALITPIAVINVWALLIVVLAERLCQWLTIIHRHTMHCRVATDRSSAVPHSFAVVVQIAQTLVIAVADVVYKLLKPFHDRAISSKPFLQ